jgi:uncharacterized protein (TIRG00374 family)
MVNLKTNINQFNLKKQEGKIVIIFILTLVVYLIFILFSDIHKIGLISEHFKWSIIPLLLLTTLCNYFFRALRFYFYLRQINIFISFKRAFSIFLSGLSMTVTPGKSGEIVKAYLLKKTHDVSVSEILPLLIIERMTDGIAMLILGLGGISLLSNSTLFFAAASLFVLLFIVFLRSRKFILPIIYNLEKKFPKFKLLTFFETFFENSRTLVSFKNLTLGIGIGCIAWAFEGYALYIIIREFIPLELLSGISKSLFIFSFSSIAGFFVLIPGGIGVAEGSISYFLTHFFSLENAQAVFITILFRFITLWFGVCLGLVMLVYNLRQNGTKKN